MTSELNRRRTHAPPSLSRGLLSYTRLLHNPMDLCKDIQFHQLSVTLFEPRTLPEFVFARYPDGSKEIASREDVPPCISIRQDHYLREPALEGIDVRTSADQATAIMSTYDYVSDL